jgi:hypothetical protein
MEVEALPRGGGRSISQSCGMAEAPRFAPAAGLPLWEKNTRVFPSPKSQRADPDLVPYYCREIMLIATP